MDPAPSIVSFTCCRHHTNNLHAMPYTVQKIRHGKMKRPTKSEDIPIFLCKFHAGPRDVFAFGHDNDWHEQGRDYIAVRNHLME